MQKDAVTNPTIKNGAITPEKFIGIIGAPNTASGSVPISVIDTGQTGDASKTKIPYFNSSNKIILDSTNSPTGALSGLSFKDGTKNFDISNDNALRIDSNTTTDLLVLDVDGNLKLEKRQLPLVGSMFVYPVEIVRSQPNPSISNRFDH